MAFANRRVTEKFIDATLIYKNFAGEKRKFNAQGDRNFNLMLTAAEAAELEMRGWNVKPIPPREGDDEQYYKLKVSVNYANRPPRIYLVTSGGKTLLGEGLVSMLDRLDSIRVDVMIVAYDWHMDNGQSGRKAFLQSLFFNQYEDELELAYGDIPQLPSAGEGPLEIEPGSRRSYDHEGEVEE